MERERENSIDIGIQYTTSQKHSPLNELLHAGPINLLLLAPSVKDIVVREGLVLAQDNVGLARGTRCAHLAHVNLLARILGSNPSEGESKVKE